LNDYAPRKNGIDAIYSAIEDKVESADVADIMMKIQAVIDGSIENTIAEPRPYGNGVRNLIIGTPSKQVVV
jgi:type I restriction enzyme R subunit